MDRAGLRGVVGRTLDGRITRVWRRLGAGELDQGPQHRHGQSDSGYNITIHNPQFLSARPRQLGKISYPLYQELSTLQPRGIQSWERLRLEQRPQHDERLPDQKRDVSPAQRGVAGREPSYFLHATQDHLRSTFSTLLSRVETALQAEYPSHFTKSTKVDSPANPIFYHAISSNVWVIDFPNREEPSAKTTGHEWQWHVVGRMTPAK
jgi:hypothetical protein